jgi:hypothetical protein
MNRLILLMSAVWAIYACTDKPQGLVTEPGVLDSMVQSGTWGDLKVMYPVYDNSILDSATAQFMDERITEFRKYAGDDAISENWKNNMQISYQEFFSREGVVSIVFEIYQFTGGAHGNTFIQTLIFDSRQNKVLYLKDVLPRDKFKNLQAFVRKQLHQHLEATDFIDDGTELWNDFSSFALTNEGLVFWFSPYQVAPYVYGIQKVEVPWIIVK